MHLRNNRLKTKFLKGRSPGDYSIPSGKTTTVKRDSPLAILRIHTNFENFENFDHCPNTLLVYCAKRSETTQPRLIELVNIKTNLLNYVLNCF